MGHKEAADTQAGVVARIRQIPPELLREIFLQARFTDLLDRRLIVFSMRQTQDCSFGA